MNFGFNSALGRRRFLMIASALKVW